MIPDRPTTPTAILFAFTTMITVTITTARSRMYSDVAICRVDAAGHRDGFEDLRVTHAADATDDDINADIDAAVAAKIVTENPTESTK